MVRRGERIVLVEVGRVVVATRVLVGDRLVAVDVPDRRLGTAGRSDQVHGLLVAEDVVQRTEPTGELVRRVVGTDGLGDVGPAFVLERLERILHGVGVEITEQEHGLVGEVAIPRHPRVERLRLGDAAGVRLALAGPVVVTRTLRLEVVHDGDEGVIGTVDAREGLRDRMARIGERRVGQHLRSAARGDRVLLVDESGADRIGVRPHGGRRGSGPLLGAGGVVESLHERLQGTVGIGLEAGGLRHVVGVLHLHETDDIGVEFIDRGHDLGLLVGERLRCVGTAHRAVVARHRGAVAVGVRFTVRFVLAQVGEVVEHIERRERHIALHGRCTRAGVLHRDEVSLRAHLLCRRLEVPLVVPVIEDDLAGELHVGTGAHGVAVAHPEIGQRRRLRGVIAHVVPRGTVIEGHGLGEVLLLIRLGLRSRSHLVRGLVQRFLAIRQPQRSVLVHLVVVGDGVGAFRRDEHALVALAFGIGRGPCGQGRRGDGGAIVDRGHRCGLGDLRHGVVLRHGAGDVHTIADRELVEVLRPVHEDAIGGIPLALGLAAGAGGLDVDPVETAGAVHRSDHTLRGDLGTVDGGRLAGALDLGDGLFFRRGRILRVGWGTTGVHRSGSDVVEEGEVSGVVVGVDAVRAADRARRRVVAGVRSRSTLSDRGRPIAHGVEGTIGGDDADRAIAARRLDIAAFGIGRNGGAGVPVAAERDHEVAARSNGAAEVARGHLIIHGPAARPVGGLDTLEGDLLIRRIVELDELVGVRLVGGAATTVELVDDEIRRRGECGRGRESRSNQGKGADGCRETDRSGWCVHDASLRG